jgi:chromatin structure-remodeling complex subunit RSC4
VNKEYNKISGEDEPVDVVHDGRANASGDPSDEHGEKKNKNKPPNMNRLLKSRLQKLVNKTDES